MAYYHDALSAHASLKRTISAPEYERSLRNEIRDRSRYHVTDAQLESTVELSRLTVLQAETFYVGGSAQALIEASAQAIPEATLYPDLLPGPAGFLLLENPLSTGAADDDPESLRMGNVDLITWALVHPEDTPDLDQEVRLAVFVWIHVHPSRRNQFATPYLPVAVFVIRVGRDLCQFGSALEEPESPQLAGMPAEFKQDSNAVMRFLAATFLFMDQRITVVSDQKAPRAERRRIEKEDGKEAADQTIRVIMLRRREVQHGESEIATEHEAREWSCSWMVSGHWRQQFYRSDGSHRPKFIRPYAKGPQDKPMKVRPLTVTAAVR